MALYLFHLPSPTSPKEQKAPLSDKPTRQEIGSSQTKKHPLAEDYMDQPPAKEAKIARLTTNTNFPMNLFKSRRQWKATQCLARALSLRQAPPRRLMQETPSSSNNTDTIRSDITDVYISARKSMTVCTYVHTIAKRTEMVALLDSGATENFMNLSYARWLKIPIKRLSTSVKKNLSYYYLFPS